MANSSGTHHHQDANHARSAFNGANPSNGNSGQDSSPLMHNPGISQDWTVEEQAILDEGMVKYASESHVMRYAKIALQLQNKNVRDVALRCRWMTKKENSKRRKEDNFLRKNRDKKERFMDTSAKAVPQVMARPNVPPYAASPPVMPVEYDDGMTCDAIGGVMGELLKQNAQAFNQISANLSNLQIQDNIGLLHQARENLYKIMNELNNGPELMRQMPPLPVKLNEELANAILPPPNHPNPMN